MLEARPPEGDESLREFLDRATLGLHWLDPEGRILWANRAALQWAGWREEEYLGRRIAELFEEPPAAEEMLARLARGETLQDHPARLRRRDGSIRQVLIDGSALFRDGRLVHSRCFTRDVTALLEREQAARRRAEDTSRLQDDFLALLSHELRAPLGTVLLWLGLLQQDASDANETRRALEIMDRSARTMEHIIEDLLHGSRIAAGGLTLDLARVDLRDVVRAAVEAASADAAINGLHLTWSESPCPLWVWGDAGRLQQAVSNLLSNAIKFTPPGGQVVVSLDLAGPQARLRVCDTGEGMSPGFLPFAFGRFRQQDSTRTRRHPGLGLGLYVVRHVVEHHGGSIHAESPGPERGSTFTAFLPLAEAGGGGAPGPALRAPGQVPLPPGLKVLVVDDDEDVREALQRILQESGARVMGAASAREAFALVGTLHPDVILSDIAMPEEDGLSFIRRVRRLPHWRGGRIPAAALSAYAGAEDRKQALLAGYQEHVRKPIEPAQLLAVIARVAGSRVGSAAEERTV